MTPSGIFSIANMIAAAGWLLLAVLPQRRWVTDVLCGVVLPGLFAVVYTAIMVATFAESAGGFSSLGEVALLFSSPWLLLAGWIHYLAFDLLLGSWQLRDARERRIPHWLVLPCLVLTFLFGPAGWLLYMTIRSARSRSPAV
jgi:hypothetical protein